MGGLKYRLAALPTAALDRVHLWPRPARPAAFVVERANWSTRWDGIYVCREVEQRAPGTIELVDQPAFLARRVVHFGSQFLWMLWKDALSRSNRFAVTFFHGKPEDGDDMARHIEGFMQSLPRIARVVTAARLVEDRLLAWGVPRDRLVRIPIGVDLGLFRPASATDRAAIRSKYGIADHQLCIGSFQKDGTGWGDGYESKLIKGPDILLDVVARVARERPVFVLLTGPARGFVKRGLAKLGVPFAHDWIDDYRELPRCYAALDVYLNPSREEGGPKGILEAMASDIAVVSTRVGMAPDVIVDGVSGGLVGVDDAAALAQRILDPPQGEARRAQLDAARTAIAACDWSVVGRQHLEEIYRPLL